MTDAYVVTVEVVNVQTGEWCPRCLLPSAVSVEIVIADWNTLPTLPSLPSQTLRWCPDCEESP